MVGHTGAADPASLTQQDCRLVGRSADAKTSTSSGQLDQEKVEPFEIFTRHSGIDLPRPLNHPKTSLFAVDNGAGRFRSFLLHDEREPLVLQNENEGGHDAQRPRQAALRDTQVEPLYFSAGPQRSTIGRSTLHSKPPWFFQ
jgi:hypothetical protein